jgi:nucleoside-diphosphate-sugar epimerase
VSHIRTALEPYTLKHVFFVSSTSVYGEEDGQWVDENTPTHPQGFNGQVLCAAEAVGAAILVSFEWCVLVGFMAKGDYV